MPATTYEKQPLVRFIGRVASKPEESKNGKATVFRFAMDDSYGDDKTTTFYDVVATKEPLREAIRAHVNQGIRLAIEGNEKVDAEYDPANPQHTIYPAIIFSGLESIKNLPVSSVDDF